MILLRGFRDVSPAQINNSVSSGLYGNGVYLTLREEVAFRYGPKGADVFGIIAAYAPRSPILTLTEGVHFDSRSNLEDRMKLTSAGKSILNTKEKSIPTSSLMDYAQAVGFNIVKVNLNYCCENTVIASSYDHLEYLNFRFYLLETILDNPSEEVIWKKVQEYNKWFNQL